jgi:hypothetical protein
MSIGQFGEKGSRSLCIHPSVGTSVSPASMTPRQKVAAVAKVRCLEHTLFDGDRVSRSLSRRDAEAIVAEVNELRRALGWLEIDLDGHWRWPHGHNVEMPIGHRPGLTNVPE